MGALSVVFAFAARLLLVLLFLPFSALDKVLNFRGAEAQAAEAVGRNVFATALIILGLSIEVFMSLGVLTGIADRAAAFVLAGYCGATALLWKQFWVPGDFWRAADGKGRALFWDFLKNFALAGGFLILAFGSSARTVEAFFAHPFATSHPYALSAEAPR